VGPQWDELRFRQPGWVVLPLRAFLGVTFIYASLQKLANPTYLDPHNRASVVGQMQSLRHTSPIGPLLSLSLHAPKLVGLLIAFGELAVALGILLGLFTRLAALGGMLLSLTFLLTVSWKTTPYYYGSDVVFLFAWTVFLGLGSGGVLSLDALFHERAVQLSRGRNTVTDLARRELLLRARAAGVVAAFAGSTGLLTALIGRAAGGTKGKSTTTSLGATTPSSRPAPTATATSSTSASGPAPGTAIGSTSQVPVGRAGRFTDPSSGDPAWVVHPTADKFVAFSAVCTHAGCPVQFDQSNLQFVCPCHGGTYDARTGQVTGGPPPSPLPSIPVHVVNGEIRVD
jgi:thiosulfate dehydrogenase [quinone] large subunit